MKKNYKFGQKNNWRRTVWNEIVRRLHESGRSTKEAIVLYLAGEQDLDRKVAIEHGFHPDNLIVVEIEKRVVKKLRKEGKIVIHADLNNVLFAWGNKGKKVDVVIADFCSGLEPRLSELHDVIAENPAFFDSIISINLQRGRDSRSNASRDFVKKYLSEEFEKHRALQFVMTNCLEMVNLVTYGEEGTYKKADHDKGIIEKIAFRDVETEFEKNALVGLLLKHNPRAYSYKSGSITFDSAVFNSPMKDAFNQLPSFLIKLLGRRKWYVDKHVKEAKHQIKAALAVRTMKLEGKLAHSPRS